MRALKDQIKVARRQAGQLDSGEYLIWQLKADEAQRALIPCGSPAIRRNVNFERGEHGVAELFHCRQWRKE
ncbi:hypothetical protein MF271_21385 (plasmid) [Deinococcus sp. KNUC1210]|uniref:hypothetical protein n=1 Tax=Deinococcus sp. KNUC1210 TaxID=2917691 RepID=UPI001EF0D880|nr:hypothetical protein [Deinococcus sp. KNUC1210]ULH17603.1 hypothetical protein MF271_21385 [Deinococcus sp. KNUC1210]